MFVPVVTLHEIERGVLIVERRDPAPGALLRRWLEEKVLSAFEGHLLAFGAAIARRCDALQVPEPKPDRDNPFGGVARGP